MSAFFCHSQNKDSKIFSFSQRMGSNFSVRQDFLKKESRSPRGFLPRPLLRAGETISPPPLPQKNSGGAQFSFLRNFPQNTFELCPTNTAKMWNSNFRQKYGRREAPSVLHSPHKILILQGFATLRVAPRLPIQFYE